MAVMHIVSFNIPFPPDQGGLIDVYAKVKSLKEAGVDIIFHAFTYNRYSADALKELCKEVHLYPRKKSAESLLSPIPFIVHSRDAADLWERINADDYPVLLEGLHSCYGLFRDKIRKDKEVWVRTHNIEHAYYEGLAKAEGKLWKKLFFFTEAWKLKKFEKVLQKANGIFCIAESEKNHYSIWNNRVEWISAFHMQNKVSSPSGKGKYAFYHGSLDVAENNKAALWLVDEVFQKSHIPLIIAGNNPSKLLQKRCKEMPHISLKSGLTFSEMQELIKEAHVHVLPTFQNTGVKLKLLHALFQGRFCLVNNQMVEGTGLESYCRVTNNADDFRNALEELMTKTFDQSEIEKRRELENSAFSNKTNAAKIISALRLH